MFERQSLRAVTAAAAWALCLLTFGSEPRAQAPVGLSVTERALVDRISIDAIKRYTNALAADAMEGRGTGQPGGEKAAAWLAAQFKRFGMKPLGDAGSYLQAIEFVEAVPTDGSSFTVDGTALTIGRGWAPLAVASEGVTLNGDLVFVGYGVVDAALKRNDLAGIDLTGKIAVMFQGRPANVSAEAWGEGSARWASLVKAGAAGVVFIENGRGALPVGKIVDYFSRPKYTPAGAPPAPPQTPIPLFGVDDPSAEMLFAKSGVAPKIAYALAERDDFRAIDLKRAARIAVQYARRTVTAHNVVGYLEGSDAAFKDQAVVFTAHYDAYGRIRGAIYNGAADNAIGTAEMLAAAEAFSKSTPRPRRSLVFMATTAEEQGLLGSRHWAQHPTWPIEKVAANLNLDGIGTEIFGPVAQVIGFGAEHSTMGAMLDEVLRAYGISLMADPIPEENVFTRSDHYPFVERGVPALMLVGAQAGPREAFVKAFKDWEAVYYHMPSDDVYPTWHWPGARTVADMMALMGWRLAQQDAMPSWLQTSPYAALTRGNTARLPGTPAPTRDVPCVLRWGTTNDTQATAQCRLTETDGSPAGVRVDGALIGAGSAGGPQTFTILVDVAKATATLTAGPFEVERGAVALASAPTNLSTLQQGAYVRGRTAATCWRSRRQGEAGGAGPLVSLTPS